MTTPQTESLDLPLPQHDSSPTNPPSPLDNLDSATSSFPSSPRIILSASQFPPAANRPTSTAFSNRSTRKVTAPEVVRAKQAQALNFFRAVTLSQYNLSRSLTSYLHNMQNDGPSSSTPSPATPSTDFPAYLTSVTSALDALTTHAASLPVGSDLRLHSTLDRGFARELRQASRKVLRMTQELLERVDPGKGRQKLEQEEDVVDGYRRGVVGAVEGLLEDAVRGG